MDAAIILFPGINRERDMAAALRRAGIAPRLVWHKDTDLPDVDLVVLPGGFSYGDYLRCGAIAARSPVMRAVIDRANAGVPVLGVCNGFQILTESGLLPGALMRNASLAFVCRDVHLRVENAGTRFTSRYRAGQVVRFPVAHGDGNYFADEDTLDRLEGEDRVVLRYCSADGSDLADGGLNGSSRQIAGIVNERGNVMGLMPHPEDSTEPLHGGTDGLALFESIAGSLERAA